jgi:allophanate hydrolase subunit 2
VRAYLAVAGGFQVSAHYGSRATVVREGLGGLDRKGSPLKNGDLLPMAAAQSSDRRCVPTAFIPDYSSPLTLRVLPGYQHDVFTVYQRQRQRLFDSEYQVTPQSDRMAYRLSWPAIAFEDDGIISEGISYGAIQIPPNGQPIIMLKDRQTIGGYPKIGCIASLDAGKLAQRTAGASLRFTPAQLEEIINERRDFDPYFGLGQGNSSSSLR